MVVAVVVLSNAMVLKMFKRRWKEQWKRASQPVFVLLAGFPPFALSWLILVNFSETRQLLSTYIPSSAVVTPVLKPFLVLKILSSHCCPWKCQWMLGCISVEAFSYIFLEDELLDLFPVCFYFPPWPHNGYLSEHVLILPPKRLSLFANTICWIVICVFTSRSPHPGGCTPHTPANAFGRSPTSSLLLIQSTLHRPQPSVRCQQELALQTGNFPWNFSSLDFKNMSLSWLSSDLPASFQSTFEDIFSPCLSFNIMLRASASLFFFPHSACSTWVCFSTPVPSSPSFSPAGISPLSTRPVSIIVSRYLLWDVKITL